MLPDGYLVLKEEEGIIVVGTVNMSLFHKDAESILEYNGKTYKCGVMESVSDRIVCCSCREYTEVITDHQPSNCRWHITEDIGIVLDALRAGKLAHGMDNGSWELVVEVGASVLYWAQKDPRTAVATKHKRPFRVAM